jgi:uncharacterized protein
MKINLAHLASRPVPIRLGCFILILLVLWLPFATPMYLFIQDANLVSILTLVVLYGEFIFLLRMWGKQVYNQSQMLRHYGLEFSRKNGVELLRGLAIGIIGVLLLFGLQGIFGWLLWQQPQSLGLFRKVILEGLLVSLGVGFAEELLFRGWLLNELERDYSPNMAMQASAGLFAVSHFIRPLEAILHTWPQFLSLVLLGLTQVWGKRGTGGRLGLPIGYHAGLIWGYYIINVGNLIVYTKKVPEWVTGIDRNPLQGIMGVLFLSAIAFWVRKFSLKTPSNRQPIKTDIS